MTIRFTGFASPRSGTAWLSNFLSYGESSYCQHEALYGCESIDDYKNRIDSYGTPVRGSIDTASPFLAQYIYDGLKEDGYRMFILTRGPDEVRKSLESIDLPDDALQATYDGISWLMAKDSRIMVITYQNLFRASTLRMLWSYLGIAAPFPVHRLRMLREMLVEDGRIKGFGRFASEEGCAAGMKRFASMYKGLVDGN